MGTLINTDVDVIVVGAGIAGLSAATSLVEAGKSVLLLEKTSAPGGSSALSGGFFAFSATQEQENHGIADSAELFRKDMVDLGGGVADERLIDAYLDAERDTYRWLIDHGVVFDVVEVSSGQSVARSHHSDIKRTLRLLRESFELAGGTLLVDRSVTRLLTDAGRVSGVWVVDGVGNEYSYSADDGVVLSTGGFTRAKDLLQAFAPEQLQAIPYGGLGNTGDGIRLAWRLGAGLADMGYVSATYGSHPETTMEFHELLTAYYLGAIIVNVDGKRFVDESKSYKILGREALKQPEGLGFQVFDRRVRAKSLPGIPLNDIGMLEEIGHVYSAETLDELAEVAGIDREGLRDTVRLYNESVERGSEDEFGRTALVNGVGQRLTVEEGPFYAYPAKPLLTTTFAGLTISPRAEVMTIDGEAIPGLFATGEVIGGFHGAAYMTGTSLGKGAVFGRIVSRTIAG